MSAAERDLLAAVLEAVTLPHDTPDYDARILERTQIARVIVRAALDGDLADLAWNAEWLRRKIREEEARHQGGEPR